MACLTYVAQLNKKEFKNSGLYELGEDLVQSYANDIQPGKDRMPKRHH